MTWRIPLSGSPSLHWQRRFQAAGESTSVATAGGVRFEDVALTFRSADEHVPEWIDYIDRWIAHANAAATEADDRQRRDTEQSNERRDVQRREVSGANEKFKNL